MFKNRMLMPGRPNFVDYIARTGLARETDPIKMLGIDGGFRATNKVFAIRHSDGWVNIDEALDTLATRAKNAKLSPKRLT